MEELETLDRDYVVISDHEDQVLEWKQDDIPVVFGEPTSTDVLEGACADRAEAMIVDTGNDRAASVVLALRELNEHADIFVLVSDRADSQPLRYAGANRVMTPKRLLGQRIAARIKTEITPDLSDVISVSGEYCALEVSVFETSPVHGKTVRQIEEQTGGSVRVAGLWEEGEFVGSPAPGREVHEDMVLFLFGPESNVKDLEDQITGESSRETSVVVAGHGDVGETVVRELDRRRMNITVVDREDGARVDVVGDVTDEDILREAGIKDAAVFVVAIKDDDKAIMSVLIASNIAREQEIIVRVNDAENMERVRRAGAEYVLGLPEITARVLARDVLNEDVLTTGRQLKMIRLEARSLPDHLKTGETEFHSRCVLLAIERGSRLITERVEEVDLKDTDHLLIVGPDEQIGDVSRMREEALEIRDVS